MRLDKYICSTGIMSRKECRDASKLGLIRVNDIVVKDSGKQIDETKDVVKYKGEIIEYKQFIYIMLNKPDGYISANEDYKQKTVLDLLEDKLKHVGLFPCGRLDIDTHGLLLLTNDGMLAHKSLSPKYHVEKKYYFTLNREISEESIIKIENGVDIGEGIITKKSKITMEDDKHGYITITEGKFHQIKRMFETQNCNVTYLKRISFATLTLDPELKEGDYRFLTNEEEKELKNIIFG